MKNGEKSPGGFKESLFSPLERPGIRLVETWLDCIKPETSLASAGHPLEAAQILHQLIGESDREHFMVLFLNCRTKVTHAHLVSRGTTTSALVHPREVFKAAFLANAAGLIVGHNHPSGEVSPSADDLATTRRLTRAGELLGIPILDSLIVGPTGKFYAESTKEIDQLPLEQSAHFHLAPRTPCT